MGVGSGPKPMVMVLLKVSRSKLSLPITTSVGVLGLTNNRRTQGRLHILLPCGLVIFHIVLHAYWQGWRPQPPKQFGCRSQPKTRRR